MSGYPVVFLHGFLGNQKEWLDIIKSLKNKYRIILFDLPGHGGSVFDVNKIDKKIYEFTNTTNTIVNILKKLNVNKSMLIGYSMGGRLALNLAIKYPSIFSKVFIESASPGLETEQEILKRKANDEKTAKLIKELNFSEFIDNWYNQKVFEGIKKSLKYEDLKNQRLKNDTNNIALALKGLSVANMPCLWNKLSNLKLPLYFIAGKNDEKYCIIGQRMSQYSQKISFKIVNNCGHNIHFENREEYLNLLVNFFANS